MASQKALNVDEARRLMLDQLCAISGWQTVPIRAALEPADTNYYFYALGKDGVHHFFKTYREHVNFVNSSQYGG